MKQITDTVPIGTGPWQSQEPGERTEGALAGPGEPVSEAALGPASSNIGFYFTALMSWFFKCSGHKFM